MRCVQFDAAKTQDLSTTYLGSTCDTEIQSLKDVIAEAMKIGGTDLTQQTQKLADPLAGRDAGLDARTWYIDA